MDCIWPAPNPACRDDRQNHQHKIHTSSHYAFKTGLFRGAFQTLFLRIQIIAGTGKARNMVRCGKTGCSLKKKQPEDRHIQRPSGCRGIKEDKFTPLLLLLHFPHLLRARHSPVPKPYQFWHFSGRFFPACAAICRQTHR